MAEDRSELYVGYLPDMPPGIARHTRRVVLVLLLAVIAVPLTLLAAQAPFARANFEFGDERAFRGTIREAPIPVLEVVRPGKIASGGARSLSAVSRYPLVAQGKFGAGPAVRGLDGRSVELRGALIYRGGQTMIELAPGSISAAGGGSTPPDVEDLGTVRLRGEIVDTKCNLGVMNPGQGKPHRDCAVRCVSGGIPPSLRVENGAGEAINLMLVGPTGQMINGEILAIVAEPVEVTGRLERRGDLFFLYADPKAIRPIAEGS